MQPIDNLDEARFSNMMSFGAKMQVNFRQGEGNKITHVKYPSMLEVQFQSENHREYKDDRIA
jgi:hypothetical protein